MAHVYGRFVAVLHPSCDYWCGSAIQSCSRGSATNKCGGAQGPGDGCRRSVLREYASVEQSNASARSPPGRCAGRIARCRGDGAGSCRDAPWQVVRHCRGCPAELLPGQGLRAGWICLHLAACAQGGGGRLEHWHACTSSLSQCSTVSQGRVAAGGCTITKRRILLG